MEMKLLSLEQIEQIYYERCKADFPKEELKPFSAIERLFYAKKYRAFGFFEDEILAGYAFMTLVDDLRDDEKRISLLDYFAVKSDLRGKGIGGKCLEKLKTLEDLDAVFLESEDPEFAKDEKEFSVRSRRIDFYLKNGLKLFKNVKSSVYWVDYRIFALEISGELSEKDGSECIERLYGNMFSKEQNERFVRIFKL